MARKIEVVDYNPEWKKLYKIEEKKIKAILGKNCAAVYHIGSTSVKGLCAKPIIDILVVVKELSLVDAFDAEFEAEGYECMGEYGIPGRRFYQKGGDERTHHIHLFEESNKNDIDRHLAVRDYLENHPDVAKEYGELKKKLALEFTYDNEGYCNGKDAFVKDLEQKALEWKKQQEKLGFAISIGMCLGVGIGSAFGTAMGNLALGMSLGMCIGMGIGAVIGAAKQSE